MKNTIKCKNCGSEIEISEALTHQIEEQLLATLESQHKLDIEQVKKEVEEQASKKIGKDLQEEKERNKKLSTNLEELLDEMRKLKRKDEERDIEMKKKIMEEEEKIKLEAIKRTEEDHKLKDLEKDKMIADLKNAVEDMRRKSEQGSQQTQGEVLELELETKLKIEFPSDIFSEVKKGQRGADLTQEVFDKLGRKCGSILWESKNAQWTDTWIAKLKEDQRQAKAELAVLVSVNLPKNIESFTYINGVWVTSWKHFLALALTLRYNLISIHHERQASGGKDEKMHLLFNYLTGTEFKHRVEGIVEAFGNLQDELEKEKRWFNIKWAKQEKEIRKVIDQTHGMYGDLQGVVGKSLPEIRSLELPEST